MKELTSSGHNISAGSTYTFSQNTTIRNLHLWNGTSDPYLYKVIVRVLDGSNTTDSVTQPLGFRSYKIDADQGVANHHRCRWLLVSMGHHLLRPLRTCRRTNQIPLVLKNVQNSSALVAFNRREAARISRRSWSAGN